MGWRHCLRHLGCPGWAVCHLWEAWRGVGCPGEGTEARKQSVNTGRMEGEGRKRFVGNCQKDKCSELTQEAPEGRPAT